MSEDLPKPSEKGWPCPWFGYVQKPKRAAQAAFPKRLYFSDGTSKKGWCPDIVRTAKKKGAKK